MSNNVVASGAEYLAKIISLHSSESFAEGSTAHWAQTVQYKWATLIWKNGGPIGSLAAAFCCIHNTRQIQTTQFAFNFPSNFPSFKTLIIHEGENFAFPKLYSENLADIKFPAMPTIRDHQRAMSCPYFWKSSEHKEVKLQSCNEFPNECVVSVSLDNPHSSQKKDFFFSSFLIRAAHNAQHQFLISASFSITAELANIRKHFAHIFCTHFDRIRFFFANFATNSYMYRKRAWGAPIWPQSVRFIANVLVANVSVVLFSCLIINCHLSLAWFQVEKCRIGAISLDQMVEVNSKCFCTISLH